MTEGLCQLCRRDRPLEKSHFIPAALYRGARGTHVQFLTARVLTEDFEELREYLLCGDCEDLFNGGGESPVLRWIAPKAKTSPLTDKMREASPRESNPDWQRHSCIDLGIEAEPFAYFALSIVWRGAVRRWLLPEGGRSSILDLGDFEEPIRRYLLGEVDFPPDVAVIVTVCSDAASRDLVFTPTPEEAWRHKRAFGILARGICFRIVMDKAMNSTSRMQCCFSGGCRAIFLADCKRHMKRIIGLYPRSLSGTMMSEMFGEESK